MMLGLASMRELPLAVILLLLRFISVASGQNCLSVQNDRLYEVASSCTQPNSIPLLTCNITFTDCINTQLASPAANCPTMFKTCVATFISCVHRYVLHRPGLCLYGLTLRSALINSLLTSNYDTSSLRRSCLNLMCGMSGLYYGGDGCGAGENYNQTVCTNATLRGLTGTASRTTTLSVTDSGNSLSSSQTRSPSSESSLTASGRSMSSTSTMTISASVTMPLSTTFSVSDGVLSPSEERSMTFTKSIGSGSPTRSMTGELSMTKTQTITPPPTSSATPSSTPSFSSEISSTVTITPPPTPTATWTSSLTDSSSTTITQTITPAPTPTRTQTVSQMSSSLTLSLQPSRTVSLLFTESASQSDELTVTASDTPQSKSISITGSRTGASPTEPTPTISHTITGSKSQPRLYYPKGSPFNYALDHPNITFNVQMEESPLVLYANAIQTGYPLEDRQVSLRLAGGEFNQYDAIAAPNNSFWYDHVTISTKFAASMAVRPWALFFYQSFEVSRYELRFTVLHDPQFRMLNDADEILMLHLDAFTVAGYVAPTPEWVMITVKPGSHPTPAPTARGRAGDNYTASTEYRPGSIISVLSAGSSSAFAAPSLAFQSYRNEIAFFVSRCTDRYRGDYTLSFSESPIPLAIGTTVYRFYLGALIMNLVIASIILGIHVIICAGRLYTSRFFRGCSTTALFASAGFPSYSIWLMLFYPPNLFCGLHVILRGEEAGTQVAAAIFLIPWIIPVVMVASQSVAVPYAAFQDTTPEVSQEPSLFVRLAAGRGYWKARDMNSVREYRMTRMIYQCFRWEARWWLFEELAVSTGQAVALAVAQSTAPTYCYAASAVVLVLYIIHFGLLLLFRPYLRFLTNILVILLTVFQGLGVVLGYAALAETERTPIARTTVDLRTAVDSFTITANIGLAVIVGLEVLFALLGKCTPLRLSGRDYSSSPEKQARPGKTGGSERRLRSNRHGIPVEDGGEVSQDADSGGSEEDPSEEELGPTFAESVQPYIQQPSFSPPPPRSRSLQRPLLNHQQRKGHLEEESDDGEYSPSNPLRRYGRRADAGTSYSSPHLSNAGKTRRKSREDRVPLDHAGSPVGHQSVSIPAPSSLSVERHSKLNNGNAQHSSSRRPRQQQQPEPFPSAVHDPFADLTPTEEDDDDEEDKVPHLGRQPPQATRATPAAREIHEQRVLSMIRPTATESDDEYEAALGYAYRSQPTGDIFSDVVRGDRNRRQRSGLGSK